MRWEQVVHTGNVENSISAVMDVDEENDLVNDDFPLATKNMA